MKLPTGNMNQIVDMVQSMMPYDYDHVAQSDEAIAIQSIFESLKQYKPEIEDWNGFLGYLIADIDLKPQSRMAVKNILKDISKVLKEYEK